MRNSRSLSPEERGMQAVLAIAALAVLVSLLFGYLGATGKIKATTRSEGQKAHPTMSAIPPEKK